MLPVTRITESPAEEETRRRGQEKEEGGGGEGRWDAS